MKDLVSIIIPMYNRQEFICETLDSIINQTYQYWECIIIDDLSEDKSFEIVQGYSRREARIKCYKRPNNLPKGANACRNYGKIYAKGKFIKWFDSDDLMLNDNLEKSINFLIKGKFDYVISRSLNFKGNYEFIGEEYDLNFSQHQITPENFAYFKIGWLTIDFICKTDALDELYFNHNIKIGDEYNYFIKFLFRNKSGGLLKEISSLRRIHSDSIMIKTLGDNKNQLWNKSILKIETAQDLLKLADNNLLKWFLSSYMQLSFELVKLHKFPYKYRIANFLILKSFGFRTIVLYNLALILGTIFNKGYKFLRYARS